MPRSASSAAIVRDTVVGDWQAPRGLCKTGLFGNRNERKARSWSMAFDYHPRATMKCMLGRLSSHLY
jgi:hypothetical protein